MLPAMRMMPRDTATEGEALVTTKAEIPAHHGSSECSARAARTANVTDAAASAASNARGPRHSSERNSVASAPGISRSTGPASIHDQGARIGAHVQHEFRARILQYQCHRKAPLKPDPVRRRLDIGQELALRRHAADAAGNALDRRSVEMPRIGVEPDPGSVADAHMADHAFLVIGENPPRMRVDQTDQGLVLNGLVADPQCKVGDRAV